MKRKTQPHFRIFLNALLIAAFMLAGISPACKFIAGEAFAMEICKADGSVIIMVMNEDGTVTEEEKPSNDQRAGSDCAFCFASAHGKILATANDKLLALFETQTGLFARSADIARQSAHHLYAPRGPPISVV